MGLQKINYFLFFNLERVSQQLLLNINNSPFFFGKCLNLLKRIPLIKSAYLVTNLGKEWDFFPPTFETIV